MTIDEAIEQVLNLGEKDPLAAARTIIKRNDKAWLSHELVGLAEDILAERARQRLASLRRGSERVLHAGSQLGHDEMRLRVFPVPHDDGYWEYKPFGTVTADDLERRARYYDRLAVGSLRRAAWCRDVIDLMAREGVETAGMLAELPALPDESEIVLPELRAA